jgi:hypothetical protein
MATNKYPTLLSEFKLGDLTLPNRVVLAPLTRSRSGESRVPNEINSRYYTQRASAGLLITEATVISEQASIVSRFAPPPTPPSSDTHPPLAHAQGIGWVDSAGIFTDEHTEGWRKVVGDVHAAGGRIFVQLWHQGRASHSSFHNGLPPVSASSVIIEDPNGVHAADGSKQPYETPRPLTTEEVPLVVEVRQGIPLAFLAGWRPSPAIRAHAPCCRTTAWRPCGPRRLALTVWRFMAPTGTWLTSSCKAGPTNALMNMAAPLRTGTDSFARSWTPSSR